MCEPGQPAVPPPALDSVAGAAAMAEAALAYLAGADLVSVPVETQAECLRGLERIGALHTVARAGAVTAFDASGGFEADGQGTVRAWLRAQTRVTRHAAGDAVAWARRLAAHPAVRAALAAGKISVSWAQKVCAWTDELPEGMRPGADEILLAAAAGGADLGDLAGLAEEMFRRCASPDDGDKDDRFADRWVRLDVTFGRAGRLEGDLTPECTAAVRALLDALGKKTGPEDVRTGQQRDHDALEEAGRRLAGSGFLPDRAGQPTQVQLHMSLSQLRGMDGAGDVEAVRAADAEAAWAAGRAAGGDGDGDAGWLRDRAAAEGYACDAQITPIVSGHVDRVALALMVRRFLTATRTATTDGTDGCRLGRCGPEGRRAGDGGPAGAPLPVSFGELQDMFLRQAVEVLSGPTGLAAQLRMNLPGAHPVSLPLDVGAAASTIPAHLRRAVISRDRHCAFPGCDKRPAGCQVHHIVRRADGGVTALPNLVLLCPFHHLIAIHRWGWAIQLHADGTTTATSPDGQRVLHSHGPPARAA